MTARAFLGAAGWLLSTAGTGAAILAWLRPPEAGGRAMRWALAMFLGSGLLALLWLVLSLLGVPLDRGLLLGTSAPGLLWALYLAVGKVRHRALWAWRPLEVSEALLVFLLVAGGLIVTAQSIASPLRSWDARTHWTMLARVLYFEHSANAAGFHDQLRLLVHRSYPLLLPLTECSFFHWVGADDDRLVRLVSAAFYGMLVLAQYGLARMAARRSVALLGTALLCTLPLLVTEMDGSASSGYADVPLAAGLACYLACLISWLDRNRWGDLILAVPVGVCLVLTKNEGLPIFAAALAVLLVVSPGRRQPALVHGACVLLPAALWLHHAHGLAHYLDLDSRLRISCLIAGLPKVEPIVVDFARDLLLRPGFWSLFWWLFLASLATRRPSSLVERYCLGLLSLMLAIHFLVDVLVPWSPDFLDLTTRSRMLVQVAPVAALFLAARLEAHLPAS